MVSFSPATPVPMPWKKLLGWFLLSRLLIWVAAGLAPHFVPPGPYYQAPQSPLDWLNHWDAGWFLNVIEHGYSYDPTQLSSVNFLPLYPLFVRGAMWVIPGAKLAAYLVSHAFCFGAAALLWRLTEEITRSEKAATAAALFFWFGPVSFFFSTIYAEGTFIFFAIATVLAARRERWLLAGALGAAAAFSRSIGVFLMIPLGIEFLLRHRSLVAWREKRTWLKLPTVAMPTLGTALYVAFLTWKFDEPRAYVVSQNHGGHSFSYPWDLLRTHQFTSQSVEYQVWFAAAVFTGILLLLLCVLMRLPWSLTAFAGAFCLLHFCVKTVEGMPRFLSAVFPFYCALGILSLRWPLTQRILLPASAAVLVATTAVFAQGYWFT